MKAEPTADLRAARRVAHLAARRAETKAVHWAAASVETTAGQKVA